MWASHYHFFELENYIEWCVVRHGFKNGHKRNMCSANIGLHAQDLLEILGTIVNVIAGHLYDHFLVSL